MQRQIYPVLLLTSLALAAAVCFRPSLVEEMVSLARPWVQNATSSTVKTESRPISEPVVTVSVPTDAHPAANFAPASVDHYPTASMVNPMVDPMVDQAGLSVPSNEPGEAFASDLAFDVEEHPPAVRWGLEASGNHSHSEPQSGAYHPEAVASVPIKPAESMPSMPSMMPLPPTQAPPRAHVNHTPGPSPYSAPLAYSAAVDNTAPRRPPQEVYRLPDPVQPSVPGPNMASISPPIGNAYPAPSQRPVDPLPAVSGGSSPMKSASAFRYGRPVNDNPTPQFTTVRPTAQKQEPSELKPCESAQTLAVVGSEVILASDVMAQVNRELAKRTEKLGEEELEAARTSGQLDMARDMLTQQMLKLKVDSKLLVVDAKRSLPEGAMGHFEESLTEEFNKTELPRMIEREGVKSRPELEKKLASLGTSLARERRAFIEDMLARQWLSQQSASEKEIDHQAMLDHYYEHAADFEHPARARWEQLTARTAQFPSKAAAHAALAEMGNQVMQGRPFAEIAKERSQGATARDGGKRDWTLKDTLVSEVLDSAIFALPEGQLSQIIEDEQGFHIVRVTEREEAHRTPFEEAQVEIKKSIRLEYRRELMGDYSLKLRERIPVWTVFDEQTASRTDQGQGVRR